MAKHKKHKQPAPPAATIQVKKKDSTASRQSAPSLVREESQHVGASSAKLMSQERAAFALDAVQAVLNNSAIDDKEFKSQVRRLPGMIQVNGFGQAMAFYYAKGKSAKLPACGEVHALLETWLCEENEHSPYRAFATAAEPRLMTAITQSDQAAYRHAQAETQALLQWVKRFCEGLIVRDSANSEAAVQEAI